jgi:hypothetical protein
MTPCRERRSIAGTRSRPAVAGAVAARRSADVFDDRAGHPGTRRGQRVRQRLLAAVCAWCDRVVSTAPSGAEVTHTICESCLADTFNPIGNGAIGRPVDHGPFRLPDRYFGFDDL